MRDRQPAALRASRIGFVFQQFFLAEHQSVLGNVADGLLYAGIPRGGRRRMALQALDRVGLAAWPPPLSSAPWPGCCPPSAPYACHRHRHS